MKKVFISQNLDVDRDIEYTFEIIVAIMHEIRRQDFYEEHTSQTHSFLA